MKITILGSGTCVPSLVRKPCSLLVTIPALPGKIGLTILIDAGPGIIGQLLKAGTHINDIDLILLSHFHLDHCAEIAPFLFSTKYPEFARTKKLTLMGGTGLIKFYNHLNKAYQGTIEMPEDYFEIVELQESGQIDLGQSGVVLSYSKVEHKPESRAYRIDDNMGMSKVYSIVYSGDTQYSESLIKLSKDADVLICESAVPDENEVPGHLTPSKAGQIATHANVKKLVLTHLYPSCDEVDILAQCRKTFTGEIKVAEDLMVLES